MFMLSGLNHRLLLENEILAWAYLVPASANLGIFPQVRKRNHLLYSEVV